MRGNLTQHHIAKTRFLSVQDEHQDPSTRAHKHPWDQRKVACNRFRFERHSPWRIAAIADDEGLAFTNVFFCFWPCQEVSEFSLCAALNSPIASAFCRQLDLDRQNRIETLSILPLPPAESLAPGATIDRLARHVQALFAEDTMLADMKARDWREEHRESLIRLDAAVLDAYGLSAAEQRKLLDQFHGYRRPVGFEFTGYFPDHFKDDITLSDFVRINYDWDETNRRRGELIQKNIYGKGLDKAESPELDHLQHLTDLMVRLKDPAPISGVDDLIAELKAEGKWPASI